LCILLGAFAKRHLVQWSAACIHVTIRQLRDAQLALPVAVVASFVAVAQALAAVLCVWFLEASVSIAAINWPAELPSAATLPSEGGTSRAPQPSDLESEAVPGGPLVRGLLRGPTFSLHPLLSVVTSLVLLHATCALLATIGRFLVAHIIAHWYFCSASEDSDGDLRSPIHKPRCGPFCDACQCLFSGRLGSVAAGAILPALLPSTAVRLLASLLPRCGCPTFCDASAAALGAAPFVEVAAHGEDFHVGASRARKALSQAPPSTQFLGIAPVIFEAAVSCLASLVAMGIVLLSIVGQDHAQSLSYVESSLGIALLAAFVAHAPAGSCASMYVAAFDTFVYCLAKSEGGELRSSMSGKHTPPLLTALFSEAAEMLRARKQTGPQSFKNVRAPQGYRAVADSSGSESD